MATQLEVIQDFMRSLDNSKKSGEEALDDAVRKACSYFKSFQTEKRNTLNIKEAFINDLTNAKSAEDFLRIYCGINFTGKDSGAITGSDAGGSKTKTEANIISEVESLKDTFKEDSFTVNDLTVTLANNKTFKDLSDNEQYIWQGLCTWWIEGALNLIAESYGENFSFTKKAKPTTKNLYVEFINKKNSDKVAASYTDSNDLKLTINTYYYSSLKDDTAKANTEFDCEIAKKLTLAVMMANISDYKSLPGFITEGLAGLTVGITNSNKDKIKALATDVSKFETGLDANNLTREESFIYEGGYIFLRYLARQGGDLTIANSKTSNPLTAKIQ